MRVLRPALFVAAAAIAVIALPQPAHAWRVFFGVPYPFYVGPPVYYAPPVVYAPPATYAPQVYDPAADRAGPAVPTPTSASCDAGAYICPLDRPLSPGAPCSCPANRGRVAGTVR